MNGLVRALLLGAALWSSHAVAGTGSFAGNDVVLAPPTLLALAEPDPQSLRLPRLSSRFPLHRAALQDDVAGVAAWAGRGIPVDAGDDEGRTPLMVAAAFGNVAATEALIALGADPLLRDFKGEAAIHFAARGGQVPIVGLLIASGVDPDFRSSPRSITALHFAATFGHERILRLLVSEGADPNATDIEGITPLQYASRRNRYELVDVLISLGARQQTLHDAVNASDVGRVIELIREGADIDAPDLSGPPVNLAAANGSLAMVRILVDAGAGLEATGDPAQSHPLHVAAMHDHPAIAEFLIARGALPNSRDDWGRTPLMVAASFGAVEAARVLLRKGADPEARDDIYRDTAIHYAAQAGEQGVAELLLAEGIPIDLPSGHAGESPLHYAADCARLEMIEFLVARGAHLTLRDQTGATPLRHALAQTFKGPQAAILLRQLGATE